MHSQHVFAAWLGVVLAVLSLLTAVAVVRGSGVLLRLKAVRRRSGWRGALPWLVATVGATMEAIGWFKADALGIPLRWSVGMPIFAVGVIWASRPVRVRQHQ